MTAMGVLSGLRVVELEAIGPVPFAGMVLADLGADVLRIDRPAPPADLGLRFDGPRVDVLGRGKRSLALDLKAPGAAQAVRRIAARADVLIEGFRPGTMERLGVGPDVLLAANPRLVYGRMTGWGQQGPLASTAGHDINYIAMSGLLSTIGPPDGKPVPPLNLLGDFGGGGLLLALGVVSAAWCVQRGGRGQVVDAAMTEGAALLGSAVWGLAASGLWREGRGRNLLDGGAPWYDTYETADGCYMAVGAIEERFYAELLQGLGVDAASVPPRGDRASWPALRERLAQVFRERTQAQWCTVFDGTDACVSPVLTMAQAPTSAHAQARGSFVSVDGVVQPGRAPRFTGVDDTTPRGPPQRGEGGAAALAEWGVEGF
jgi:alpha-methylacyl-CoA racemase